MTSVPIPPAYTFAGFAHHVLAWRFAQVEKDQADPRAAQDRAFRAVKAKLAGTIAAEKTGLEGAPDLDAFAANVPARDYDFFEEMVARTVDRGEKNVLFRGTPAFVGLSSGTAGANSKRIVHDATTIKAFEDFEMAVGSIIACCSPCHPLMGGRLAWGVTHGVAHTDRGIEQGYISGYLASHPSFFMKKRTLPPPAIALLPDMKEKIAAAAKMLRDQPIHLASAVPSYLLNLLEELRTIWGIEDFEGIWPDMKVVMYSGTPIDPYRAKIIRLLARDVQFIGMYLATECPVGYEIPKLNGGVNGLFSLHLGSTVFTFRKLDGDGRISTIDQLAEGDDVEVLLTMSNGLVNYRLGDCLKIRKTKPLLFEITGRVGHGLNVATEKTTLRMLARAATAAAESARVAMAHYFVCPGTTPSGRPCYAWTLMVENPESVDREAIAAALDRAMRAENADYEEFRENPAFIDPPMVDLLDASVARRYFERERHRGQLKMKTAFDSKEKLEELLGGLGVARASVPA